MRRRRGESHPLDGAPESFEIVILTGALAKDVHDEITIVEKDPFRAGFSFPVRHTASLAMEFFFDRFADGLDLRLALSGAKQEIFRECARTGKV